MSHRCPTDRVKVLKAKKIIHTVRAHFSAVTLVALTLLFG